MHNRARARLLLQVVPSTPAQTGALSPEPQAAAHALQAAAASAAAAAAAAEPACAAAAAEDADSENDEPGVLSAYLLSILRRAVKRMLCSLEITNVKFGVYDKSQVRIPLELLNMLSSIFLIYLCLMQAISFAVPYSIATLGQEVTPSPLRAEELSPF